LEDGDAGAAAAFAEEKGEDGPGAERARQRDQALQRRAIAVAEDVLFHRMYFGPAAPRLERDQTATFPSRER
jgi:hypothetical protein